MYRRLLRDLLEQSLRKSQTSLDYRKGQPVREWAISYGGTGVNGNETLSLTPETDEDLLTCSVSINTTLLISSIIKIQA